MWQANIGRLMWKEYRVQRSVWLSLLAGTALLQLVVAWSAEPHSIGPTAYVLAYVFSACYAAACAGILFAGEREEETDLCLRQLPLPSGRLVTAKLLFALLTIAAFAGVSLLSGWAASLLADVSMQQVLRHDLSLMARAVVGVFIWGLLFSLLLRRVLVVVLCTAVTELVVTGVVGNFTEAYEHRAYFAVVGTVALVDLWLGLRWAAGDEVLPMPHFGLRIDRVGRSPSTRWVRWLSRSVQRGSPLARTCNALAWRELRTAASFCVWWIPLGILLVDLLPRSTDIPANTLFLLATPLVCGLLVCLGDQRQQSHRFLCERGIAAVPVWVCKQAVWFLLMLALTGVFGAWDALTPGRFQSATAGEPFNGTGPLVEIIQHTIHVPGAPLQAPFDRPVDRALQWEFVWALGLSLYVVGQLASFWIRRSVLAFGAALIGAIFVGAWLEVLTLTDVPLVYGAWPVVIAWSAATLFLAGRWLRSDARWPTRLWQGAWVIVPALGVVIASATYRIHQVPLVYPETQWPLLEYQRDQFDAQWSHEWRETLGELGPYASRRATFGVNDLADNRIESRLVALGDALAQPRGGLGPQAIPPGENPVFLSIGTVLHAVAQRHEAEGDLPAAWHDYAAGLRLTSYLARQCAGWEDWQRCLSARVDLLDGIRQWAANPAQTSGSLRAAVAFLTEAPFQDDGQAMLVNRCILFRQILEHRGRYWDEYKDELSPLGPLRMNDPLQCARAPAFERERMLRLVGVATHRLLADSTESEIDPQSVARWAASTPLLALGFQDLTDLSVKANADAALRNLLANDRGTAVVVALYAYKLDHGAFPDDLSELTVDGPAVSLRDPCGEGQFGYRPQGFPKRVLIGRNSVLPAEQPMLWSVGAARATIVRAAQTTGQAEPYQVRAGEFCATDSTYTDLKHTPGEIAWLKANPDRIVFAILGLQVDPDFVLPPGAVLKIAPDADQTATPSEGELK